MSRERQNESIERGGAPRHRHLMLGACIVMAAALLPSAAASSRPAAPAAACASTAEVHMPKFDHAARQMWAAASVRRCGPGVKACVYLHFGRVIQGWGPPSFLWSPWSSKCVNLSLGVLVVPTTPKKRCDPGLVYTKLYIYNSSGDLIDTDTSGHYDATSCAT